MLTTNQLTLCILETHKRVFWQTVQPLMKCSMVLHSSGSALFAQIKKPSGTEIHHRYIENSICDPLKYTMDSLYLIVSICMEKSIRIQRVKEAYPSVEDRPQVVRLL